MKPLSKQTDMNPPTLTLARRVARSVVGPGLLSIPSAEHGAQSPGHRAQREIARYGAERRAECRVQNAECREQSSDSTEQRAESTDHRAEGTGHTAQGTGRRVQSVERRAQSAGRRAQGAQRRSSKFICTGADPGQGKNYHALVHGS